MPSAFEEFFAIGRAVLQQQHGWAVTYLPPAEGAVAIGLTAIVGPPDHRLTESGGMHVGVETRDFVVATAELAIGGTPIEPAVGGRFTQPDAAGGDGYVYEVANRSGEPCWEWADERDHSHRRIHTAYIGRVSELIAE